MSCGHDMLGSYVYSNCETMCWMMCAGLFLMISLCVIFSQVTPWSRALCPAASRLTGFTPEEMVSTHMDTSKPSEDKGPTTLKTVSSSRQLKDSHT